MNRDEILAAEDLPTAEVAMSEPGWPAVMYVRTLTGIEVEALGGDQQGNFLGRFAALVLCDEKGDRLFTDEDGEALGGKSHFALKRICDSAQSLNGMDEESQEELAKN